jgi:hypothetical protein
VNIDSMPGKLDALTVRVGSLESRMHETVEALAENTAITRVIADHTGALVEMVRTYGEVKTTAKVVTTSVTWTGRIAAAVAAIGGVIAAAWHWFRP